MGIKLRKLSLWRRLLWKYDMYCYRADCFIHNFLINKIKLPLCHGWEGPCFRRWKKRRQNTSYVNEESNWVFLCDRCMKINHEHWQEMWNDYYRSVM